MNVKDSKEFKTINKSFHIHLSFNYNFILDDSLKRCHKSFALSYFINMPYIQET